MFNWGNLATQIALGTFAGYITNTFAINMLFKEYKPFKIGGVIKKTKNEFIENISDLVENSIITHEKVYEEFSNEKFIESFKEIFDDILEISLNEKLGDTRLNDFPAFDELVSNLKKDLQVDIDEVILDLTNHLMKNSIIEKIIGENDLQVIILDVIRKSTKAIEESDVIDKIICSIIDNFKDVSIIDLFDSNLAMDIKKNLYDEITSINDDYFRTHEEVINKSINSVFDIMEFEKLMTVLYEKTIELKLNDLLTDDNSSGLGINMTNKIDRLLASKDISEVLIELIQKFIKYLNEVDKTIFDLVTPKFETKFEKFLRDSLPIAIETVTKLIRKYSAELEDMIFDSLDQSIESSKGLRAEIVKLVKNGLIDYLKKEYPPVKTIVESLENNNIDENCEKIIKYLKENKIKDLIDELINNKEFSKEKITNGLVKYLGQLINALPQKNKYLFTNKPVKLFISHDQDSSIRKWINISSRKLVLKLIMKDTNLKHFTVGSIDTVLKQLENVSVGELLRSHKNKTIVYVKSTLINVLTGNDEFFAKWLSDKVLMPLAEKSIFQLIPNNTRKAINDKARKFIKTRIVEIYDKNKNVKVVKVKNLLDKIDFLSDKMSKKLHSFIRDNLKKIMNGNVKKLVKDNLGSFNEDEICDLVQEFMGKELKPITYLGAILGGLFGILPGLFQPSGNQDYLNILFNVFVCGFVGWFTNVLAIEMLFKPYRKNRIISKVPFINKFSIGYILSNKDDFALNMANFVQNDLLDVNGFEAKISNIYSSFKFSLIEEKNEDVTNFILSYLNENKDKNINWICESLNSMLYQKKEELIRSIIEILNDNKFDKNSINALNELIVDKVSEHVSDINDSVNKLLHDLISTSKLNDYLINLISDFETPNISKKGSKIIIDWITSNNVFETFIVNAYKHNSEKTLGEFIDLSKSDKMVEQLLNYLLSAENLEKIYSGVSSYLEEELKKVKTLEFVLNGSIKMYLDKLIDNFWENKSNFLLEKINANNRTLKHYINKHIRSKMSRITKLGYNLFNGDAFVDKTIDSLLNGPIPLFLGRTKDELKQSTLEFVDKSVYSIRTSNIDDLINKSGINNVISEFIENDTASVRNKLSIIICSILTEFNSVKISTFAKAVDLDSEFKIRGRLQASFTHVQNLIVNLIIDKHNQITACIEFTINQYLNFTKLKANKFKILIFTNKAKLKQSIDYMLLNVEFDDLVKKCFNEHSKGVVDVLIYQKSILEFVSIAKLEKIFDTYFVNILNGCDFKQQIKTIIYRYYDILPSKLINCVPKPFNISVLSIILDVCYASIIPRANKILSDINFDKITETAIKNMSGKEIHNLFNSFAGKYFKKLKNYGWFGGIFGLVPLFGIIGGFIYILNEKKNELVIKWKLKSVNNEDT